MFQLIYNWTFPRNLTHWPRTRFTNALTIEIVRKFDLRFTERFTKKVRTKDSYDLCVSVRDSLVKLRQLRAVVSVRKYDRSLCCSARFHSKIDDFNKIESCYVDIASSQWLFMVYWASWNKILAQSAFELSHLMS